MSVNTSDRKEEISTADREFVADLLKPDNRVIELANVQLTSQLSNAFSSLEEQESALTEFQDRCSRRYHNFRPLREPGEPLPTEAEKAADKSTNLPDHTDPSKRSLPG